MSTSVHGTTPNPALRRWGSDRAPELWTSILKVIIQGPSAWLAPMELAAILGLDVESTTDVLAAMDVAGYLDVWDVPGEPVVTLSAWAAERFRVQLVEIGTEGRLCWSTLDEPQPAPIKARGVCRSEAGAALDYLVDPEPPPDVLIAKSGTNAKKSDRSSPTNPVPQHRPTVFLGLNLVPWPGPGAEFGPICPACRNRQLSPHMYCLYCDRSGADELSASGTDAGSPQKSIRKPKRKQSYKSEREANQAAQDRQRRKERRQRRLAAQAAQRKKRSRSNRPTTGWSTINEPFSQN